MATVGSTVEGSGPAPWGTSIGGGTRCEQEATDVGVSTPAGIVLWEGGREGGTGRQKIC